MKQILETDRLFLREFDITDSKNFYDLNQNPNVVKFTGDKPFQNILEAKAFFRKLQRL